MVFGRRKRWNPDLVSHGEDFPILPAMRYRPCDSFWLTLFSVAVLAFGCAEKAEDAPASDFVLGEDPAATILEILDEPDRLDRTEKLIPALHAVLELPGDKSEVFEAILSGLHRRNQDLDRILIQSAWARADAPTATKWAIRREFVDIVRNAIFDDGVYEWARQDPEAVIGDMDIIRFSSAGWDKVMLRALVRGWFDSGKPGLEDFIRNLSRNGDDRQRAISEYIEIRLARDGAEPMIEWVKSLQGNARYRAYAYSRLAADIAKVDPARAIAWCEEICDTKLGEDFPLWISSAWALSDGAGAMDWLLTLPDTVSARSGARASFRRFMKNSIEEASAWMDKRTEEERRNPILQGPVMMYSKSLSARKQFEKSIEWAGYLKDDDERERVLEIAARRWLRNDREGAEAWLKDAPISEETKVRAHQDNPSPRPYKKKKS